MPTPVYIARTTSYQASVGELGQPATIRISKVVNRVDGAVIDADNEISEIEAEGHIPVYNQLWAAPSSGMTWEQFARQRSIDYTLEKGGTAITFNITYSTLYFLDPAQSVATWALPSSIEFSSKVRTARLYRTGWSVVPPTTSANSSADIGGTAIGGGHTGQTYQINQVAVRIRQMFDASDVAMNTLYADKFNFVGKRNSLAFGGFPAYSLFCEGLTAQKTNMGFEFYELVFDLLFDPWYHFDQVPTTGEDSQPVLNNLYQPDEVKWIRLGASTMDFNLMFPDGSTPPGVDTKWRDLTLKGWWQ